MSSYNNKIVKLLDLDVSKIQLSTFDMKVKDNFGGKRIFLQYVEGETKSSFSLTTPKMTFPFGLSKFISPSDGKKSYTIAVNFSEWKEDSDLTESKQCFLKFVELENRIKTLLWENYEKIFEEKKQKKDLSLDFFVENTEKMASIFKYPKNDEEEKYSPTIKFTYPYYPNNKSGLNFPSKIYLNRDDTLVVNEEEPQESVPFGSTGYLEFRMSLYVKGDKRVALSRNIACSRLVDYTKNKKTENPFSDIPEEETELETVQKESHHFLSDDDI